ncbi:MAG: iron-containing alcohol dehydrogenase, partial [Pirellulales bacterium]
NSGLGMAHGVAAALGIHASVPHGLACAVMLPIALAANRAVAQRAYAELAEAIGVAGGCDEAAASDAFVARIIELGTTLGIPQRLRDMGVTREQIPLLVRDARGNSMQGSPRTIEDQELTDLLSSAL